MKTDTDKEHTHPAAELTLPVLAGKYDLITYGDAELTIGKNGSATCTRFSRGRWNEKELTFALQKDTLYTFTNETSYTDREEFSVLYDWARGRAMLVSPSPAGGIFRKRIEDDDYSLSDFFFNTKMRRLIPLEFNDSDTTWVYAAEFTCTPPDSGSFSEKLIDAAFQSANIWEVDGGGTGMSGAFNPLGTHSLSINEDRNSIIVPITFVSEARLPSLDRGAYILEIEFVDTNNQDGKTLFIEGDTAETLKSADGEDDSGRR